jgi:hypothetical protein
MQSYKISYRFCQQVRQRFKPVFLEVPSSNLGCGSYCADIHLSWFSMSRKFGTLPLKYHDRILPNSYLLIVHDHPVLFNAAVQTGAVKLPTNQILGCDVYVMLDYIIGSVVRFRILNMAGQKYCITICA